MATGGVNQYYRPVDPLVLNGPAHLISERWRKWKRSFLFFISAQDITDPNRKHSFLLHFAGEAVQDLFETLSEPVLAVDDRFERTIAMLDKHFNVAKNTPFKRHCFRQMAPTAGETVDKFIARLRLQAQHCSFADLWDKLRDQLAEKIDPPALRRKLLERSSIKLQDALKLTRAWEAADVQSRTMSSHASQDVNRVSSSHAPQSRTGPAPFHVGARWCARAATSGIPARPIRMYYSRWGTVSMHASHLGNQGCASMRSRIYAYI